MPLWHLCAGCHAEIALCLCLKSVKWHLFHKKLNISRCHFLRGLVVCLRPCCGTRCFFSVCAWLLWIELKGGFAAVAKVVVAIILIPPAALHASRVVEPHPITQVTSPFRPAINMWYFRCYRSRSCHLPHHGGFSTLSGRRQWFSYVSWYYCSTKISIDMTKASKCWVVSPPLYLPKFLNVLCWSAPWWSSSRADGSWKKDLVKTTAYEIFQYEN